MPTSTGQDFWVYDGTNEPFIVADIITARGASSSPKNFSVYNNKLYFAADDGSQVVGSCGSIME